MRGRGLAYDYYQVGTLDAVRLFESWREGGLKEICRDQKAEGLTLRRRVWWMLRGRPQCRNRLRKMYKVELFLNIPLLKHIPCCRWVRLRLYREHELSRGKPNKLYGPSNSSHDWRRISEYLTIIFLFLILYFGYFYSCAGQS
jgi:hypothetical protein